MLDKMDDATRKAYIETFQDYGFSPDEIKFFMSGIGNGASGCYFMPDSKKAENIYKAAVSTLTDGELKTALEYAEQREDFEKCATIFNEIKRRQAQ